MVDALPTPPACPRVRRRGPGLPGTGPGYTPHDGGTAGGLRQRGPGPRPGRGWKATI